MTAKQRGAVLRNLFDLMIGNIDDLALILTTEQGKPLAQAKGKSNTRRRSSSGLAKKQSARMVI